MGVISHTASTANSVLNVVSTTASAASKGIGLITVGLDIAESYALDIKADQLDSAAVRKTERRRALLLEASREAARLDLSIASEMHANPQTKALFDSHYDRLSALFA